MTVSDPSRDALHVPTAEEKLITHSVPVGDVVYAGWVNLRPTGRHPVRIESAELLNVPEELVVEGTWAANRTQGASPPMMGARSDLFHRQAREAFHPLYETEVLILPGVDIQDWWLVVGLRTTEVGRFQAGPWQVGYTVRGRPASVVFTRWHIIEVVPEEEGVRPPPPLEDGLYPPGTGIPTPTPDD